MKQKLFYDINKFPRDSGIILFPISLSRISKSQSAAHYIEHLKYLSKKTIVPEIGCIFLHTNGLYNNSSVEASNLKNKHTPLILNFINNRDKLLLKNHSEDTENSKYYFYTKAFQHLAWTQAIYNSKNFHHYFEKIKKLYSEDKNFQKYVLDDYCFHTGEEESVLSNETIDFYLEEHILIYVILYQVTKIEHKFTRGDEKRILLAYPGPMLKHQAYILQNNFLKFDSVNVYKTCHYDLENKVLYDATNMDIDTYDYAP